jgi:hypothetical protein
VFKGKAYYISLVQLDLLISHGNGEVDTAGTIEYKWKKSFTVTLPVTIATLLVMLSESFLLTVGICCMSEPFEGN